MRHPTSAVADQLTLADLVVLSLLTERPMHGYELNQELERREVRDWAGVSRPQVYYSLKKLARAGLLRLDTQPGTRGGDRQVYTPSARGRRALAASLAREEWAEQRPPPPFLTWLCLSAFALPESRRALIRRRRQFLQRELAKERATLEGIRADTGLMIPAGELVVELAIGQMELELSWLDRVERRLASG